MRKKLADLYRVVFSDWDAPEGADLTGYNAWDYLTEKPPSGFPTYELAHRWIRHHHRGPDPYGVLAVFDILRVGEKNPSPSRKSVSAGGRGNPTSPVVREIHRQLVAQGINPRLSFVEWGENTLKVSKGQNGSLIHYDAGADLYDVTEYHGFDKLPTQRGIYVEALLNEVIASLSPREGYGAGRNPGSASGVKFVYGILGKGKDRVSEVQSVLLDKARYTVAQAKKWLQDHGFKHGTVDEGEPRAEYLRFRQQDPGKYHSMRTGEVGAKNPDRTYRGYTIVTGFGRWRVLSTGIEPVPSFTTLRAAQAFIDRRIEETGKPETRTPAPSELHLYKPLLRPVDYKTVPDGWEYVEAPMEVAMRRPDLPLSRHKFGVIGYSRQLTEEEKRDFDLEYLGTGKAVRRNPAGEPDEDKLLEQARKPANRTIRKMAKLQQAAHDWGLYRLSTEIIRWMRDVGATQEEMERYWTKRRNPDGSSSALYESFHGAPSTGSTIVEEEVRYHGELAEIGALVELKVNTLSGYQATLNFDGDPPILCSSPDRKQLYLRGGDQSLDLSSLRMDGPKWERDSMIIGVLDEITYHTAKGFDSFKPSDYFHPLGEDTGVQPMLIYDRMNHLLSVSGGQYKVKNVGIVN